MKHIKKVIIENFQSHAHTELDFELGLNIIIGQSDKGKSAVLRAIKWVLYNEPRGSDFIRFGTNECTVTIITGDNYTITRKRKGNKNIYTVIKPDGEKLDFENFGNNVPNEVIESTGVKIIKLDTDLESKLNLNEQLDPPFLLSETGTIRAKAIGRIVNTNIIDAAERDILKDISNNNLVVKGLEKQISDIEQELTQYANIDDFEKTIQKLENLLQQLSTINETYQKLKEWQEKLLSINEQITQNKAILGSLRNLPSILELHNNLKDKFLHCQRLSNLENKINNLNTEIKTNSQALDKVKHLDIIERNTQTIDKDINTYNKLVNLNQKYKEIECKIAKGNEYMVDLKKDLKSKVVEYGSCLQHLGKCPTCYSTISQTTLSQIISEMEGEINGSK